MVRALACVLLMGCDGGVFAQFNFRDAYCSTADRCGVVDAAGCGEDDFLVPCEGFDFDANCQRQLQLAACIDETEVPWPEACQLVCAENPNCSDPTNVVPDPTNDSLIEAAPFHDGPHALGQESPVDYWLMELPAESSVMNLRLRSEVAMVVWLHVGDESFPTIDNTIHYDNLTEEPVELRIEVLLQDVGVTRLCAREYSFGI